MFYLELISELKQNLTKLKATGCLVPERDRTLCYHILGDWLDLNFKRQNTHARKRFGYETIDQHLADLALCEPAVQA